MANKKKNEAPKVQEEVKKENEAPKVAKKEVEITVTIPIDQLNPKDKEVIVGINEKYAKVVRGEPTKVSKAVWEQLHNAGLV